MNKCIAIIISGLMAFTSCKQNMNEQAGYAGQDISNEVNIIRKKTTKEASLQIDTKGRWIVYAGAEVENINFDKPVAEGAGNGVFPINVPLDKRSYFQVKTDNGDAILAERQLPMKGGFNFRDIGGYRTKEGKYVKWGKLFRTDDLHNLTDDDLHYLSAIPIITVVDFRAEEEINQAPDKNPSSVKENYKYSINPGNMGEAIKTSLENFTFMKAESLMVGMNILLVSDSAAIEQYRKFFRLLQNDNNIPLLYHCSAGKDRTGMATALILSALGVDEQTIMKDYLLSNTYLANKYASIKEQYPAFAPLLEVKSEYLQAGLDRIKEDHGSIEKYLTEILDVDIPEFREKYLY